MSLDKELTSLEKTRFFGRLDEAGLTADAVRALLDEPELNALDWSKRSWQPEPIRPISVHEAFDTRLAHTLEQHNIHWLHTLIRMDNEDILRLSGIGAKSLQAIRHAVGSRQWSAKSV